MANSKISSLATCLLTSTFIASATLQANAEDANICAQEIIEGAYSAFFQIKEFYPGSELHRQTISIKGTPEIVPLEEKSIKTHSGPVVASINLEKKNSIQAGEILKAGKWDELQMTMTLPRISANTWYHKNCTIETKNYMLFENQQIEGDYTNHCHLMLQDAQREVLNKEDYIDYSFSGDDHWQPLTIRYDLIKLREFEAKVESESARQLSDFKAGKCSFQPFG